MKLLEPNEEEKLIMRTEAYQAWRHTQHQDNNMIGVYWHTYAIAMALVGGAMISLAGSELSLELLESDPSALMLILNTGMWMLLIGVFALMMPAITLWFLKFRKSDYVDYRFRLWGIRREVE